MKPIYSAILLFVVALASACAPLNPNVEALDNSPAAANVHHFSITASGQG